jgi:hypothetical protein
MTAPLSLSSLARASWVHVTFAFIAMGGWALFANRNHGLDHAVRAGMLQGVISAALTFGIKRGLETLNARLRGLAALLVPPVISCAAVFALLVTAHTLAGTPEIWLTIAVPFSVSSAYAFIYTASLQAARRRAGDLQ